MELRSRKSDDYDAFVRWKQAQRTESVRLVDDGSFSVFSTAESTTVNNAVQLPVSSASINTVQPKRDGKSALFEAEPKRAKRDAKSAFLASQERKAVERKQNRAKMVAFVVMTVITAIFSLTEIGVAIWINALVLLADGFHNLSDVISLGVAIVAQKRAKKGKSNKYSYGQQRAELVGALINGSFLLALCLYIVLETIPRFISPTPIPAGLVFVVIASVNVGVNVTGVIVFGATGMGHSHSHGHEGHGHGHDHAHSSEPDAKGKRDSHDHEHGDHDGEKKKKKKKKKDHGHDHEHGHGGHDDKAEKKGEHEHDHEHGGHDDHKDSHAHSHEDEDSHDHDKKHDDDDSHSHGHHSMEVIDDSDEFHGKSGRCCRKPKFLDYNVYAIFLHFLGDALSSLFVLATALLVFFFPSTTNAWVLYIDPAFSLAVVAIILWTTIPMVRDVASILLQSTPEELDVPGLKAEICKVAGVVSVHDLHIWQLVGGVTIASVHLDCTSGPEFSQLASKIRKIFHRHGIHSITIQPEFVEDPQAKRDVCEEMCVEDCDEKWCCEDLRDALDEKEAMLNDGISQYNE